MPSTVLSIQSRVVVGHAGNDAAAFALQRLSVVVWPIHAVHFSNHPGHGADTRMPRGLNLIAQQEPLAHAPEAFAAELL